MKKIIVALALVLAFFVFSCDLIPPDTTVINNSSFIVSFKYSNTSINIETLSPSESTSTKYSYSSIIILQPEKRIAQNSNGGSGPIILADLQSWEVHVENKTENPITLTANGWMDNMINIPIGDFVNDVKHIGKLYTKNPIFVVESSTFPLDVQWQFNNNVFYVRIR